MCSGEFFGIDVWDCGSSSIEELVDDGTEKSIWTDCEGYQIGRYAAVWLCTLYIMDVLSCSAGPRGPRLVSFYLYFFLPWYPDYRIALQRLLSTFSSFLWCEE